MRSWPTRTRRWPMLSYCVVYTQLTLRHDQSPPHASRGKIMNLEEDEEFCSLGRKPPRAPTRAEGQARGCTREDGCQSPNACLCAAGCLWWLLSPEGQRAGKHINYALSAKRPEPPQ